VIAPIGLVPLFKGRPGRRGQTAWPHERAMEADKPIVVEMPGTIGRHFVHMLLAALEEKGFAPSYSDPEAGVYQMVKSGQVASLKEIDGRVTLEATPAAEADAHAAVQLAEDQFLSAVQQIHEVRDGGEGGKARS
jgi:hypothetical protein